MLKNSTPWVWLEWIEFFSFFQHFSAFWKLMNAHFSKNSCYSRYSIINEWPHCVFLKVELKFHVMMETHCTFEMDIISGMRAFAARSIQRHHNGSRIIIYHGIQISMEAISTCHPALSTEWLDWVAKWCELWRIYIRTSSIMLAAVAGCLPGILAAAPPIISVFFLFWG